MLSSLDIFQALFAWFATLDLTTASESTVIGIANLAWSASLLEAEGNF